jgi:hypothetical protein
MDRMPFRIGYLQDANSAFYTGYSSITLNKLVIRCTHSRFRIEIHNLVRCGRIDYKSVKKKLTDFTHQHLDRKLLALYSLA